jgi:cobalt-zinc-cadmium efflux system membrane fusion protein
MKVRIKLKNPGYLLKPEMFANITVNYVEDKEMLAIPSRAVIFDKNRNFVMVYKNQRSVETREISIYKNVDGVTYCDNGLREGEAIISRYHLLVYDAVND